MSIKLNNPTDRELTLYIQCTSTDDHWLFSPRAIGALKLNARARDEVRLEVSYLSNRQPESSPTCELRVPFQKRDGGWLDYTVNIEAQADR